MGYYRSGGGSATLKDGVTPDEALAGLKATMMDPEYLAKNANGGRHPASGNVYEDKWYSWTNSKALLAAKTLAEFVGQFFEHCFFSEDGRTFEFSDDNKIGQEDVLFEHLAPFLQDDEDCAYWTGEDATLWKWIIRDGTLIQVTGQVSYPEV